MRVTGCSRSRNLVYLFIYSHACRRREPHCADAALPCVKSPVAVSGVRASLGVRCHCTCLNTLPYLTLPKFHPMNFMAPRRRPVAGAYRISYFILYEEFCVSSRATVHGAIFETFRRFRAFWGDFGGAFFISFTGLPLRSCCNCN